MYPKISIVTPSFNQGQYIEQTINSILDQHYPNLEYIIIDGGSTDNTVDIIKKYEKHLTYWVSEKDRGQSEAINKGFKRCTGDVFNWINSDDYLGTNSLKTIGDIFSDPGISCLSGYVAHFNNFDNSVIWKERTELSESLAKTIAGQPIRQPGTWFRRDKIEPFFPLDMRLHFTMDLQLWMNYLLSAGDSGFRYSDEILAYFRHHEASKTEQKSGQSFLNYSNTFFQNVNSLYASLAEHSHSDLYIQSINKYFSDGKKVESVFIHNPQNTLFVNAILAEYLINLLRFDYFYKNKERFNEVISVISNSDLSGKSKMKLIELRIRNFSRNLLNK